MNNYYKNKYIKYKNKYLKYKLMIGAGTKIHPLPTNNEHKIHTEHLSIPKYEYKLNLHV